MKTATVAEIKARFGAGLKASEGEPVVVTRNGKPVAVVLAVTNEEELERLLMAHSPRLQAILEAAHQRLQAGAGIPNDDFWKQVERGTEVERRVPKPRKGAQSAGNSKVVIDIWMSEPEA